MDSMEVCYARQSRGRGHVPLVPPSLATPVFYPNFSISLVWIYKLRFNISDQLFDQYYRSTIWYFRSTTCICDMMNQIKYWFFQKYTLQLHKLINEWMGGNLFKPINRYMYIELSHYKQQNNLKKIGLGAPKKHNLRSEPLDNNKHLNMNLTLIKHQQWVVVTDD